MEQLAMQVEGKPLKMLVTAPLPMEKTVVQMQRLF
jgi:hypothetical protein